MRIITSRTNPEIKAVCKLESAHERIAQNRYRAEGLRTCATLIQSDQQLITVYATDTTLESARGIADEQQITLVSDTVMEKISISKTPSGILAIFEMPTKPAIDQLSAGIVLANITDPGNMGTLIRSCIAMGKRSVVIVDGVDPWNQKVIHASAGTIGKAHIFKLDWHTLIKEKKDLTVYGLVVSGGESITTIDKDNALLVVGNEAHGIPDAWLTSCDKKITLSMPGKTESLNAAVAGSIALYLAWADSH